MFGTQEAVEEAIGGLVSLASRAASHKDLTSGVLRTAEEIAAAAPAQRCVDAAVRCTERVLGTDGSGAAQSSGSAAEVPVVPSAANPLALPGHPIHAALGLVLKLIAGQVERLAKGRTALEVFGAPSGGGSSEGGAGREHDGEGQGPTPLLALLRRAMGAAASAVRKDATVCLMNFRRTFGEEQFDATAGKLLSKRQLDLVCLFGKMKGGGGAGGVSDRSSVAGGSVVGGRGASVGLSRGLSAPMMAGAGRMSAAAAPGGAGGRTSRRFRGLARASDSGKRG